MIATSILGILASGFTSMMANMFKATKRLEEKATIEQVRAFLRSNMDCSVPQPCPEDSQFDLLGLQGQTLISATKTTTLQNRFQFRARCSTDHRGVIEYTELNRKDWRDLFKGISPCENPFSMNSDSIESLPTLANDLSSKLPTQAITEGRLIEENMLPSGGKCPATEEGTVRSIFSGVAQCPFGLKTFGGGLQCEEEETRVEMRKWSGYRTSVGWAGSCCGKGKVYVICRNNL